MYMYLAVNGAVLLDVPSRLLAQRLEYIILVCMLRELVVAVSPQPCIYPRCHPSSPLLAKTVVLPLTRCRPPIRRFHHPISPSPPHRPRPGCGLDASALLRHPHRFLHPLFLLHNLSSTWSSLRIMQRRQRLPLRNMKPRTGQEHFWCWGRVLDHVFLLRGFRDSRLGLFNQLFHLYSCELWE